MKVSLLWGAYLVLVLGVLKHYPNPGYLTWIKPSNHVSTSSSSYCRYSNQVLGSMNKCSVSKNTHLVCNRLIHSKVSCFCVKGPWRFFQGSFFIIRLVFSWKCGCFIRWRHWFGWYFPSFLIIFFIRQNYNSILCHTDTFFFPYFTNMMKCAFQLFLSLVYYFHHFSNLWILVFVRVKSKNQGTTGFFHIILCWRLTQIKNVIIQFITFLFLRLSKNSLNEKIILFSCEYWPSCIDSFTYICPWLSSCRRFWICTLSRILSGKYHIRCVILFFS